MSQYDELLDELEVMTKAMDASADEEDEREDGDENEVVGEEDADGDGDGEGDQKSAEEEAEDDDEPMGKSFIMRTEDGAEIEAVDGTELVKSLMARLDETESSLGKALKQTLALVGRQTDMIKSLQSEVEKMGATGRGRRTVVNVHEKPALAKSTVAADDNEGKMTVGEVMTKALDAQKAGRLSGTDIAIAEAHLNRGTEIPDRIMQRIVG